MSTPIERIETPDLSAREATSDVHDAFDDAAADDAAAGPTGLAHQLGQLPRGPATGVITGRLSGVPHHTQLFAELLFGPKFLSGQGFDTRVIRQAEVVARGGDRIGIRLETFRPRQPGLHDEFGFRRLGRWRSFPPALAVSPAPNGLIP
jgi:hypothetical protein